MAAPKMDAKSLVVLAAISAGAYIAYRLFNVASDAAKKVADTLTETGGAIGSKVFDLFHPNQVGETLFYSVTFSGPVGDGQRHSVPSSAVTSDGVFLLGPTWGDGKPTPLQMRRRWRIKVDRSTGAKYADPV
jgi:hypothetical protein